MATLPPPEKRMQPKPLGVSPETHANDLWGKRYGTDDTVKIFGAEIMFGDLLYVQGQSVQVLSDMYPDYVPPAEAKLLVEKANITDVSPARIREFEAKKNHDIDAVNRAWEEQAVNINPNAGAHVNKLRASADSSVSANALQMKKGLEVVADSVENLRDIVLEKSLEWINTSHIDTSHLLDALPTVAGRPFSHYAEMLQSDIFWIKTAHDNSIIGKWSDATGNCHSAVDAKVDGRKLEREYCKRLGVGYTLAPAQTPGREFIADVLFVLGRTLGTVGGLAEYVRQGRGSDRAIFRFPRGNKGSSSMPQKDLYGGNPIGEEQAESFEMYINGVITSGLESIQFDYARDLKGSALDRISLEGGFKCTDHAIRTMSKVMHSLILVPERCEERVLRSYGTPTAPTFVVYLTDPRRMKPPMSRSEATDLIAELATSAFVQKKDFYKVLLEDTRIVSKIPEDEIRRMANPITYIGDSKDVVNKVYDAFHGKKTF